MTFKQKTISAYLFVALLFGIYGWQFGQFQYKGFFYNLGRGLIWPATVFPALGAAIGAIVIIVFVILILVFGKSSNN